MLLFLLILVFVVVYNVADAVGCVVVVVVVTSAIFALDDAVVPVAVVLVVPLGQGHLLLAQVAKNLRIQIVLRETNIMMYFHNDQVFCVHQKYYDKNLAILFHQL